MKIAGVPFSTIMLFLGVAAGTMAVLVGVLQGWTPPPYPLHVVYPTNRHLSAKLRVFVDWAVELFAPYNARAAR